VLSSSVAAPLSDLDETLPNNLLGCPGSDVLRDLSIEVVVTPGLRTPLQFRFDLSTRTRLFRVLCSFSEPISIYVSQWSAMSSLFFFQTPPPRTRSRRSLLSGRLYCCFGLAPLFFFTFVITWVRPVSPLPGGTLCFFGPFAAL